MHIEDINFNFYFIKNQHQTSIFGLKGWAEKDNLILNNEKLPFEHIFYTRVREKRIVLVLDPSFLLPPKIASSLTAPALMVLETKRAKELGEYINRVSSAIHAEKNREILKKEGKGDLYRVEKCPQCQSVIDLSGIEKTPYIYCNYCETIFSSGGTVITDGRDYYRCEQCNMFSKIRVYTEFYFYFLLVVYGFSMKKVYICSNCASSLFWKVLLWNLIFILGVPSAIWLKIKSMSGKDETLAALERANYLARKGNFREAAMDYSKVYTRYGEHPGVIMNEGMANIINNNPSGGMECFKRALKACSNYGPVLGLLAGMKGAMRGSPQKPAQG